MNNMELIEGCIHNDNVAQHLFYEQHSSHIMGICMRYGANDEDTKAMVRHVFKRLYEEIKQCSLDTDINEWVNTRTIWNAIDYLHQDKQKYFIAKTTRYNDHSNNTNESFNESEISKDDMKAMCLSALRSLTPSYRILYNLTYIDEVSPGMIVKNLEIAGETYKAELEQARFQFKQHLTTYLHEHRLHRH